MKRRDVIQVAGGVIAEVASGSLQAWQAAKNGRAKKNVIVMGAGISGLSCAYELVRLGHQVTVLEAAGRAGGHVRTFHDQFADGLYADVGAEHFYYPGYTAGELARYWPEVTRPVGRIHFAGAYAAAMSWGQEAALESANRAAMEIDRA